MKKIKEVAALIFNNATVRDFIKSVAIGSGAILAVIVFFTMCVCIPGFGMVIVYTVVLVVVLLLTAVIGYFIRESLS